MNTRHTKYVLLVGFIAFASLLSAQTEAGVQKKLVSLKEEPAQQGNTTEPSKKMKGYAFTKRIPALYSGYAVELTTSELPLKKNHPDFRHFGKIYHEKTTDGTYAYVILADFNRKESAEKYMKDIVLHRIPTAHIVRYKNGKRTVKTEKNRRYYMPD